MSKDKESNLVEFFDSFKFEIGDKVRHKTNYIAYVITCKIAIQGLNGGISRWYNLETLADDGRLVFMNIAEITLERVEESKK